MTCKMFLHVQCRTSNHAMLIFILPGFIEVTQLLSEPVMFSKMRVKYLVTSSNNGLVKNNGFGKMDSSL